MGPFELLILIVLFYLVFRLLGTKKRDYRQERPDLDPVKHDILIEDPVCRTYVPKSQALSLDLGEKIYYFCSKKCRDAFCRKEEEKT